MAYAQVHRFSNSVGVAVSAGKGVTVYMSPAEARKLARALNRVARSIDTVPASQATCGTFAMDFDGSIYREDNLAERAKSSA